MTRKMIMTGLSISSSPKITMVTTMALTIMMAMSHQMNLYGLSRQRFETRIKHEALKFFEKCNASDPIANDQQYWMKCGLSSILDLANVQLTKEFLKCDDNDDWEPIQDLLTTKYHVTEPHLSELFGQTWDIVEATLTCTNDINKAKTYVNKAKSHCRETGK
ncbi:hypothetical protein BCV72DRAFT_302792 [Rhizopus microsporus var. microsporus]|uniref:Uncharacterized protein n=2 Tax=Rhizopus microsporus TaxID=58291 RepID=A0A2G4T0G8_RHIZD|nr:uncharacterized protein RHIMIDRAFT_235282 [Rhizopus microsporus ATCC 52813]XP_023468220.1 uncharacterized protein RHIMIDRAFT_235287 [Rhizopus microsporus ATCC 52813]ORE09373.1 hypothetical protein BCV72DRAFT_302792 [Rhizopus microsporus var. microsporus]PHZ14509.1 hypothetical protein RHIMIDRAFT_235282 [Rhizopus microsporus ATCC 52813]PHZ14512.1 hypothetical protein RHIMIDRAFT_235287 [Rhizopus microsporus ATCC 52813]